MKQMRKVVFKRNTLALIRSGIASVFLTLVIIVMVVFGLRQTEQTSKAEGLRLLKESLMRASIKCYAVEGSYPESVAYIEEHYGVVIDRTRYTVHYEIFASNLLPDITVIEL